MTCDPINAANGAARAMLDTFASVGAEAFDVTTTTRQGAKVWFRGNVPLQELRRIMPAELAAAARLERNVIVRPRCPSRVFIQLDDLTADAMQRVQSVSFLGLETSPQNYQAWIAMRQVGEEFARQVRKGAGADPSASGATRVAGSVNFKDKYAPDFPRVQIVHRSPGLIADKEVVLSRFMPTSETVRKEKANARVALRHLGVRRWPSYQRCIEGAPPARDDLRPDISRADFTWCMIAIDWGWSVEDTAARLMEESSKARENGERYARLTSRRAAAAIDRRRSNTTRLLYNPG
jgi:hypothetical protein